MKIPQIRKFLVAAGAAAAVAVTVLADGHFSVEDGIAVALAVAGALGVYATPNKPAV
jgi:hypothetical protein